MTGKEKCEFLKEIRKNMAKENGIPYEPRECHYEGDCTGTCPLCEKEAAELLAELKEKEKNGEIIQRDNEAIEALEQVADRSEEIDNDKDRKLFGYVVPGFWEADSLSDEERQLEKNRISQEEKYRQASVETESKPKKLSLFGRLIKKLSNRLNPPFMGDEYGDVGYEIPKKVKTPRKVGIPSNQCLNKEVKIDNGPDIIWIMDNEDPVISPFANIKSDNQVKQEDSRNPL